MPVHDLGYRGWHGRLVGGWRRIFVIASTGIRRSWQSSWLRRTLLFAWLPTMWFGFGLFAWEQSRLHPEWQQVLRPFLDAVPSNSDLQTVLQTHEERPEETRHLVWAWLLLSFFRYPQAVLMVMVVGFVGPSLISQDIRSRAFLLYFSRPLNRLDYILGKVFTLWFYLACISTIPALSLYLLGVLLSPQIDVLHSTWDIPLRVIAASMVLMVPTSLLALCLSSLTQQSRYAAFSWFAVWILGWFTYGLMSNIETYRTGILPGQESAWTLVSLYHMLGRVQSWVFGFTETSTIIMPAVLLSVMTIASLFVLLRQVAAPMRV